jgi:hypothetical protein
MRMAVTMAAEMVKAAAKAAGNRAAVGLAIWTRHRGEARTAVDRTRLEPACDGADGSTSHQGQDDAARAFHETAPPDLLANVSPKAGRSDRENAVISRRHADQLLLPKPAARANEPKPPRTTPDDDDSGPWAAEPPEEEPPPKKDQCVRLYPLLPPPDELDVVQAVPVCGSAGAAIPGGGGAGGRQLCCGISA